MFATQTQIRGFSLAEFWRGAVRAWRHDSNETSSGDTTRNGLPNDPVLIKRFNDEHRILTLRNARVGCWFVILLMPLCTILDVLSYPQHLHVFVALRLISSLVGVILLLGIDRTFGQKYYSFYPALLPLIPSICVSYMMYFAKDPGSHYYAGLSFCMVSTCFVFNWTFREILATLSLIVIIYLAATLPHMVHNTSNEVTIMYLSNLTFIILNCIVLVATSFQHNSIRIREFLSRCQAESRHHQLSVQNDELLETINRLRDTEAQLDHSDRLASIGRLSAGIIHEINNPLNFVKSALYVLNKKTRTMPPDLAESVTNITRDVGEGVDRVVAIVSDLRTFAHPDQRSLHPVSVDSVLSKAERFLARDISDHHIQLSIQSSTGIQILADDREILQVLINLLQNSIDALHDRPKPSIQIACQQVGSIVQLSVTDNGTGITQDQASKIFDPFYTTKEVGKGMGLGLSICYRMMQQMEGDIEVESIPGEYTRFTLIFQSATSSASISAAPSQLTSTPA